VAVAAAGGGGAAAAAADLVQLDTIEIPFF